MIEGQQEKSDQVRQHLTALVADPLQPKLSRVQRTRPSFLKIFLPKSSFEFKAALFPKKVVQMKTLGINTSPAEVRFAVISFVDGTPILHNADSENRLIFPVDCDDTGEKAKWLFEELARLFETYSDIEAVVIRMNNYGQETKSTRVSTHLDGVALLASKLHNKIVKMLINSQLGVNQKKVKGIAEKRVGKTDKYWNDSMAYAVVAALSGKGLS